MKRLAPLLSASCVLLLAISPPIRAAQSSEARALSELRNTVVNLLQGLVERGVLSREQAEQMVRDAQGKATAEAGAQEAQEQSEEHAVRVPYVPQIVKDEIRKQVTTDLSAEVAKEVVESARSEGWGVPAALPDWVKRMRWNGDIRVRGQSDLFADDNAIDKYIDFQRVNAAGGIGRAGRAAAFINTSQDRQRMRARLRLGFDASLGYGWSMGARIATGSLRDSVSTNQTLGTAGARYQTGLDLAYLEWAGNSDTGRHVFNASAGRIRNPWFAASDLIWDQDLTFEGVAANYRLGLVRDDPYAHFAFVTLGAFPIEEVELTRDKWLLGGQMGLDWKFGGGSRLRAGAGYFYYRNLAGQRNSFESNLLDYTAPQWMQRGNTTFDIRNDNDSNTNLFALAADYHLANLSAVFDWRVSQGYRLSISGDYVQNIGYDEADVLARTGFVVAERNEGYQGEIGFGTVTMQRANAWRAYVGYRYVEGDAVLDGFTDSDFRLGGTDVKGYIVGFDYGIAPRVLGRARYLSGNEIDGFPLGIDVLQLDITASF